MVNTMAESMNTHMDEMRLVAFALDGETLTPAEAVHVEGCAICRGQIAQLRTLGAELALARRSQPSAAALARYAALFDAQPQGVQSWLGAARDWLAAQLAFDSRGQGVTAGVRSAATASYRLLYAADDVEIEMMVERSNGTRRLVGEVLRVGDEAAADDLGRSLVQLLPLTDGAAAETEAESDDQGRFHLVGVTPGRYSMVVMTADGRTVTVEALELT